MASDGKELIEIHGETADAIATLTSTARASGRTDDIMSGDKDFVQLLDDEPACGC
ncbi:hypothetical protein ACIBK8_19040 [Streptomyces sp. NPDC050161]|uniref:hypothetical protein n=1 Tax=Streptomyces sp. NPDC050161 TaxID=3365604 RepID=UPI0037BA8690